MAEVGAAVGDGGWGISHKEAQRGTKGELHHRNPAIIALAGKLGRGANSVAHNGLQRQQRNVPHIIVVIVAALFHTVRS